MDNELKVWIFFLKIWLYGHKTASVSTFQTLHCIVAYLKILTQNVTHRSPPQRCPQSRSRHGPRRWPRSGTRPRQPWSPDESAGCCLPAPGTCLHSTAKRRRTDEEAGRRQEEERERGGGNDKRTTVYDRERGEIRKLGKQRWKIAISTPQ